MSSLGCRSIPSRVILQIQVNELLLESLNINIDLINRAPRLFPFATMVYLSQLQSLGVKLRSVMLVTIRQEYIARRSNHGCV